MRLGLPSSPNHEKIERPFLWPDNGRFISSLSYRNFSVLPEYPNQCAHTRKSPFPRAAKCKIAGAYKVHDCSDNS